MTEPIDLQTARRKLGAKPLRSASPRHTYRSDSIYADRIEGARIISQLSQEQVAELTNISLSEIQWFESGMQTPSYEQLAMLAEVIGFPIAFFCKEPMKTWPDADHTSLRFH